MDYEKLCLRHDGTDTWISWMFHGEMDWREALFRPALAAAWDAHCAAKNHARGEMGRQLLEQHDIFLATGLDRPLLRPDWRQQEVATTEHVMSFSAEGILGKVAANIAAAVWTKGRYQAPKWEAGNLVVPEGAQCVYVRKLPRRTPLTTSSWLRRVVTRNDGSQHFTPGGRPPHHKEYGAGARAISTHWSRYCGVLRMAMLPLMLRSRMASRRWGFRYATLSWIGNGDSATTAEMAGIMAVLMAIQDIPRRDWALATGVNWALHRIDHGNGTQPSDNTPWLTDTTRRLWSKARERHHSVAIRWIPFAWGVQAR